MVIRVKRDRQNESVQDLEAWGDHIKTFRSFSARKRAHAPWHHEKGGLAITELPFLKAFKVNRVLVHTEGTLLHVTLSCTRERCSSCHITCCVAQMGEGHDRIALCYYLFCSAFAQSLYTILQFELYFMLCSSETQNLSSLFSKLG